MAADDTRTTGPLAAGAASGHMDTRTAATEVAYELHDAVGKSCDLAIVFASYHHRAALPEAVDTVRQTIGPRTTLAVTAESVLGGEEDLEGRAGLSALALRLPGATVSPWMSTPSDPFPLDRPDEIAQRISLSDSFRAAILLCDPYSTPITELLPALAASGGPDRAVPVMGAMASGASRPNHNLLVLDDRAIPAGAVGVSIAGDVDVGCLVSQGCRPIGRRLVVTAATKNVIESLGGRVAGEVLKEITDDLGDDERTLLERGLLLGLVIDEHKPRFGRDDFLIRNVVGMDRKKGSLLVGDLPRVGQTVQFHVRDAVTADEDLHLLLDGEQLRERPAAAILFTCSGRGRQLFGAPNHDVDVIRERLGDVAIAGFFAAGEIGPLGTRSYLHGHTASLALIRPRPAAGP